MNIPSDGRVLYECPECRQNYWVHPDGLLEFKEDHKTFCIAFGGFEDVDERGPVRSEEDPRF